MSGRAGRVSLYVTLGIAAIDMLTCAFISSVVLFVMFLVPHPASNGASIGTENLVLVQWEIGSAKEDAVLGLEIGPADRPAFIWTDSSDETLGDECGRLSKAADPSVACYMAHSSPDGDTGRNEGKPAGQLIVQQPQKGDWMIRAVYGDALSHGNADFDETIEVQLIVVGRDAFETSIELSPGMAHIVADAAQSQDTVIRDILHFE